MDYSGFKHIEVEEAQQRVEELVDLLEAGTEAGFVLCRQGEPSASLLPA